MIKYVNEAGTVVMTQDEEDMKPRKICHIVEVHKNGSVFVCNSSRGRQRFYPVDPPRFSGFFFSVRPRHLNLDGMEMDKQKWICGGDNYEEALELAEIYQREHPEEEVQ